MASEQATTEAAVDSQRPAGAEGERLVDLLPDAVLRINAQGRVIDANPAAAELTGYPLATLIGAVASDLLDPQTKEGQPLLVDGLHRSARLRSVRGIPEHQVLILCADGAELNLFVTGAYSRDANGEPQGATLVLRDAGRRAHQTPTGMEIVSTVSHELRSPLTSVKGYTGLLLSRWDRLNDEQKKEMLEQVHQDADRVKRLIDELLDISRLETGRLQLRRQMVKLSQLVASVVDGVGMGWPDLDVTIDVPDDVPEVFADPDKLTQVLTNLVENACKYGSPTGLSIKAEVGASDVSLSVTDTGQGIPEADLPKVFNKFFRRDLGRPTGSGLGLWISRGLVEAHGGRLTATSIVGTGTTFRFTLPLYTFDEGSVGSR
jgi:PAS domain S-box-containing protein